MINFISELTEAWIDLLYSIQEINDEGQSHCFPKHSARSSCFFWKLPQKNGEKETFFLVPEWQEVNSLGLYLKSVLSEIGLS